MVTTRTCRAILSLAILGAQVVRAERLPVKPYTTSDGLAHETVRQIYKDSRGFLWFCTAEGLSRFDGARFVTYGRKDGLPDVSVTDIIEHPDGSFWVATDGEGLYRFEPATRSRHEPDRPLFVRFPLGEPGTTRVLNLHIDKTGRLWVGTGAGLFSIGRERQPERVHLDLPSETVPAMVEDRRGTLWVATPDTVVAVHDNRETIVHREIRKHGRIRSLLLDGENRLWVGAEGSVDGYAMDMTSSRWVHQRSIMLPTSVRAIYQDSYARIWAGSGAGLFDVTEGVRSYGPNEGVSGGAVNAFGEDGEHNLWVGTDLNGALKITRQGFVSYSASSGSDGGWIGSIFETADGALHVNDAKEAQLHRFNGRAFECVRPRIPSSIIERGRGYPRITLQDSNREWWVPVNGGLYRFGPSAGSTALRSKGPIAFYTVRDGLAHHDLHRVYEDSHGDLWITAHFPNNNGLTRWRRQTGVFRSLSTEDGLPASQWVFTVGEDAAGNIWAGFRTGTAARYRNGRFTVFGEKDFGARGVQSIFRDSKGRLWFATESGLVRCDNPGAENPQFVTYKGQHGLASNRIWALSEDRKGNIYVATGRGVNRLDPSGRVIEHFTRADGLAQTEAISAYCDRLGNLWFGTHDGISRLPPRAAGRRSPPTVWLAGFSVGDNLEPVPELGTRRWEARRSVPSFSTIRFEYFGIVHGAGDSLRYQHKIEGIDHDWSAPDSSRNFVTAVAPGDYNFAVRAVASDGSFSAPATASFSVVAPVWQRWWFLLACAVALGAIAHFTYQYRTARLVAVERVRTRIASDLHDDVGSVLSQVSVLSEVIMRRPELHVALRDRVASIAELSREAASSISDIVWAVNPDRDNVASLAHRMRRFATDACEAHNVVLVFQGPESNEQRSLDAEVRRQVYLICKEGANNALRHSGCSRLEVGLSIESGCLILFLSDDGIGFDQHQRHEGNGLDNMRRRAAAIGARLDIETSVGCGTTLRLVVPGGANT